MAYRISLDSPFVRVWFTGVVSGDDLLAVHRQLEEHERELGRVPDRLVDLSEMVKTGLTFHVVLAAARHRSTETFTNPFRSALVAPTEHAMGFARLFRLLNSNPQIELEVFPTVEAAETWLRRA